MEKMKQLEGLRRLAEMHADRARLDLAQALKAEQEVQAKLSQLKQEPPFHPESPEEAIAAQSAQIWRGVQRRKLLAHLAECKARTQPLKEATAQLVARAQVLDRLAKGAKK